MREAIYEMSKKALGITAVVDGRRAPRWAASPTATCAGCSQRDDGPPPPHRRRVHDARTPRTIAGDELAAAALQVMEDHRITSLFVCDEEGRLEGIVHLHDLWGLELF